MVSFRRGFLDSRTLRSVLIRFLASTVLDPDNPQRISMSLDPVFSGAGMRVPASSPSQGELHGKGFAELVSRPPRSIRFFPPLG